MFLSSDKIQEILNSNGLEIYNDPESFYLQDKTDLFVLAYGPFLVEKYFNISSKEIESNDYGQMFANKELTIMLILKIFKYADVLLNSSEDSRILFNLRSLINNVNKTIGDRGLQKSVIDTLNRYLLNIKELKNSVSTEGVMQAYSPIVPYTNTVSKPNPTINKNLSKKMVKKLSNKFSDDAKKIINDKFIEDIETTSFEELYESAEDSSKVANVLKSLFSFGPSIYSKVMIIIDKTVLVDYNIENLDKLNIMSYYIIASSALLLDDKEFEVLRSFTNGKILEDDIDNVLESLLTFTNNTQDMSSYNNNMIKDLANTMRQKIDIVPSEVRAFDIEKLKNFIAVERRYVASHNIANMFLKANNVTAAAITYNDIPIAEYDGKYLVAPVIDIAKQNKPYLIIMDRQSNINIKPGVLMIEG